jgi:hypothetical protein
MSMRMQMRLDAHNAPGLNAIAIISTLLSQYWDDDYEYASTDASLSESGLLKVLGPLYRSIVVEETLAASRAGGDIEVEYYVDDALLEHTMKVVSEDEE